MSSRIIFTVAIAVISGVHSSTNPTESTHNCAAFTDEIVNFITSDSYVSICRKELLSEEEIAELRVQIGEAQAEDRKAAVVLADRQASVKEADDDLEGIQLQDMVIDSGESSAAAGALVPHSAVPMNEPFDANLDIPGWNIPAAIPVDDYITLVAADRLGAIQTLLANMYSVPHDDWNIQLVRSVNLELYNILTQTRQMSTCASSPACMAWIKLLAELHHRVAIAFQLPVGSYVGFTDSVNLMLHSLLNAIPQTLSNRNQPRAFIGIAVVGGAAILVPILVDVGCCCLGLCIRQANKRFRATTPEPETTTPAPVDDEVARKKEALKILAEVQMRAWVTDMVSELNRFNMDMIRIEAPNDEALRQTVDEIRMHFMQRLMPLAMGVLANGQHVDIDGMLLATTQLSQQMSRHPTLSNWVPHRNEILATAAKIHAIILPFL